MKKSLVILLLSSISIFSAVASADSNDCSVAILGNGYMAFNNEQIERLEGIIQDKQYSIVNDLSKASLKLYIVANTDFMNVENVRSFVSLSKINSAKDESIYSQADTSNSAGLFARRSFGSVSYRSLTKLLHKMPSCSN